MRASSSRIQLREVRLRNSNPTERMFCALQVRVEEMRQSAASSGRRMEGMPEGPYTADAPKVVCRSAEKMKTPDGVAHHHFKIVTEGFRVPEGGRTGDERSGDGIRASAWDLTRVHIHGPVLPICRDCRG